MIVLEYYFFTGVDSVVEDSSKSKRKETEEDHLLQTKQNPP